MLVRWHTTSNHLLFERLIRMCSTSRAFISGMVFDYPEGAAADALERKIAPSLPDIPELDTAMPAEVQAVVMTTVIANQFAAFVKVWSDPFWSDEDGTETPDSMEVPSTCVVSQTTV